MDLYLDDDSADQLLARLLRNAGHHVLLPVDIGRVGSPDAVHLRQAIRTAMFSFRETTTIFSGSTSWSPRRRVTIRAS